MLFESYEAMAAYGTWFSGILTAIAVFSSVIITSRTVRKKIRITLNESASSFVIKIHNESKDPILVHNVGIYVNRKLFDLVDVDDNFISPGESKSYEVYSDRWNETRTEVLRDIHWDLNNSLFMQTVRWLKREETYVDRDKLHRNLKMPCYSCKLGIQLSDGLYTTKKWLTIYMLDPPDQRQFRRPDHGYDLSRCISFDGAYWSVIILALLVICGMTVYNTDSAEVLAVYFALVILLYYVIGVESGQKSHPASYYITWGTIIGLSINVVVLIAVKMSLDWLIAFEFLLWFMVIFGVIPKLLIRTGRAGNLY